MNQEGRPDDALKPRRRPASPPHTRHRLLGGRDVGVPSTPAALVPLLLVSVALAATGAVVGMNLITTLGISANTSVIGALVAMLLGRLPLRHLWVFRATHAQVLVQTTTSGASFGAAHALLLPIAVPFALGRSDLVWPMLAGVVAALCVDALMLYWLFDTRLFPAAGAWPPGVATAETLMAGDEGGQRVWVLVGGAALGLGGGAVGLPMSAVGVALIGNAAALAMFGVGLLVRGYAQPVAGIDVDALFMPHGVMVGAAVVALLQIGRLLRPRPRRSRTAADHTLDASSTTPEDPTPAEVAATRRALGRGLAAFAVIAAALAALSGFAAEMSAIQLAGWVAFAAVSALVSELIVGLAAMQSGWFPAFGTALIFLVLGTLIGFPPAPLAVLAGYTAATGPAFADMGYDLKAGWLLRRRHGADAAAERRGRHAQLIAELVGFVVALAVTAVAWGAYFGQDLLPPVVRVYAATIRAGTQPGLVSNLLVWALPGALIQWIGGPRRQLGVLFATGLLITMPVAGWCVLATVTARVSLRRLRGERVDTPLGVAGAGMLVGDSLWGFGSLLRK